MNAQKLNILTPARLGVAIAFGLLGLGAGANAAPGGTPGGGGHKPPTGETGVSNLSFPVILSDNVAELLGPRTGLR